VPSPKDKRMKGIMVELGTLDHIPVTAVPNLLVAAIAKKKRSQPSGAFPVVAQEQQKTIICTTLSPPKGTYSYAYIYIYTEMCRHPKARGSKIIYVALYMHP
jgi:hypothetical protein